MEDYYRLKKLLESCKEEETPTIPVSPRTNGHVTAMMCRDCQNPPNESFQHTSSEGIVLPKTVVPLESPVAPTCSACGSPSVQKVSMAWRSGIRTVSTQTGTVGIGSIGVGVAVSNTTGVSQSGLTASLAPPSFRYIDKESNIILAVGFLSTVSMFLMAIFLWPSFMLFLLSPVIGIVAGVLAGRNYANANKEQLKREQEVWESQWVCNACGHTWLKG